jgi:hypothetical protein
MFYGSENGMTKELKQLAGELGQETHLILLILAISLMFFFPPKFYRIKIK